MIKREKISRNPRIASEIQEKTKEDTWEQDNEALVSSWDSKTSEVSAPVNTIGSQLGSIWSQIWPVALVIMSAGLCLYAALCVNGWLI